MKSRYIRISTATQSTLRQLDRQHPDEKLFIDVISGSVPFNERPSAKDLLFEITMKTIDTVSCSSVDRLGRNAFNVQETIELFNKANVTLNVDNLGLSSIVNGKPNPIFKMICDVLSNVAQMEKENLLERQREGIKSAKAKNPDTYKGRVLGSIESDEVVLTKYKKVVSSIKKHPTLSYRAIAMIANCAPNTVKKVKAILDK
ncbi:MAG: recombinase family protein [Flavobacterium sp. JAD_PAG50586_2]|jgi:DNA invertase Pin-like site-specific DNA recombinase|nr:MAG: recombinase family protein [Flavobacterium sp. JAD_PAG50586_2]